MLALLRLDCGSRVPALFKPVGEYTPVQRHAKHVILLDPVVKYDFHETMGTQGGFDMTLKKHRRERDITKCFLLCLSLSKLLTLRPFFV